jgi:trehalose 6-phosphate synthase
MLAAHELRRLGVKNRIGFFLHIPFPFPDMYMKLPWRMEIICALLEYDLLGFQTPRDRNNFVHCVNTMIRGLAADIRRSITILNTNNHKTMAGIFPISIDFKEFTRQASTGIVEDKAKRFRLASQNRQIILGLDRLDYSKGIPERLRAFGNALRRFPELVDRVTMVQVVVPSREDVSAYTNLRNEIERIAGKVNGEFTQPGWVPIHYMYRGLDRTELLAYYLASDIALITPLKDGMNLISKEYCAAKVNGEGVLILSEFAGAASQLHGYSLLVNPYDIKGIADQIFQAFKMLPEERRLRMRRLRNIIARRDIYWWVRTFLNAAYRYK